MNLEYLLPIIFAGILIFALLVYIILDGYDLGIGMLFLLADDNEKDQMIATIGPFWDANETWIVLGIGVLLIAFPKAHGVILTALYLPITLMLMGLMLRGVSFDFRAKAKTERKKMWNRLFAVGSFMTAIAQGWMLGFYVMGLEMSGLSMVYALAIALALPAVYIMLGCGWLFVKTEGALYQKAAKWARIFVWPMGVGLCLIAIGTPIASATIASKWFTLPAAIGLLPIPVITLMAFAAIIWLIQQKTVIQNGNGWLVFMCMIIICVMSAIGLAYSIFPDVIIDKMTIWETASSTASLKFTLVGVVLVVPMILFYTFFIYRIFSGKATALSYE